MSLPPFPPASKPGDSNLNHALLYHSSPLGWWVFPGRDDLDTAEYRRALERKYQREGLADPLRLAAERAERGRKSTFERWRDRRALGETGRPTEAEIRNWFEDRPLRPVIVLTGALGDGSQVVGVDVDPLSGGDAGPWTGDGVTMLASTPRGGVHAYHLAGGGEVVRSSVGQVAPGVDIRAEGGLLVAPSGEDATPGRVWLRWGPPSPAPLAEIRKRLAARGKAKAPLSRAAQDIDPDAIPDAPPPGEFVQACTQVAPPGKRQGPVGTLVGNLARRCPLPHDMVEAALDLLIEARGDDPEAVDGWREALEADSRSLTFTLKVLHAWNKLRVSPPWPNDELETTTRSLWNTSLSREMATNAARSIDVEPEEVEPEETQEEVEAPEVAASEPQRGGVFEPPTKAPLPLTPEQQQEEDAKTRAGLDEFAPTLADAFNPDGAVFHAPDPHAYQPTPDEEAAGEVDIFINERNEAISRSTARVVRTLTSAETVEQLLPSRRRLYGRKEYQDKLATPILSCAVLPPWQVITATGVIVDHSNPYGHGFGPEIDVALAGGLRPGYFAVLGAKTAKAGKTALADQLCDGLLLRSLDVLAKLARGEKTSELIVVRYDFSEMPDGDLTDRQLGRWLGIDSTTFRRGDQAHLAPGIQRRAPDLHIPPRQLADMVIEAGGDALEIGRLADLRDLQAIPQLEELPSRSDPQPDANGRPAFRPLDFQTGPLMLRRIVTQIKAHRRLLAAKWGVPESQICPLLFVDPIQRFQGGGDGDSVGALDGFAKALKKTAADLRAIVIATSDTNKDSATGAAKRASADKSGKGDTRNQGEKVAATLRGSYGLTHAPDITLVLAVDDEDAEVKPGELIKVRLITGANRWLRKSVSIPLFFDPETGRYTPRAEDAPPPTAAELDETIHAWRTQDDEAGSTVDPGHAYRVAVLRESRLSPNEAQTVSHGVAGLPIEEIADLVLTADGAPSKASTIAGYFESAARKWGLKAPNPAARLPLVVAHAAALLGAEQDA